MSDVWSRIRPLVLLGWGVAAIRFALEFFPKGRESAFGMSVFFVVAGGIILLANEGRFAALSYPKLLLSAFLLGLLCWTLPNIVAYTTAQFQGWTFGRFAPNTRSAPLGATTGEQIRSGVLVGLATTVSGSVWCVVFFTLAAWLPRKFRRAGALD